MLNNLSYLFNILSCILSSIRLIYRMNEKNRDCFFSIRKRAIRR